MGIKDYKYEKYADFLYFIRSTLNIVKMDNPDMIRPDRIDDLIFMIDSELVDLRFKKNKDVS